MVSFSIQARICSGRPAVGTTTVTKGADSRLTACRGQLSERMPRSRASGPSTSGERHPCARTCDSMANRLRSHNWPASSVESTRALRRGSSRVASGSPCRRTSARSEPYRKPPGVAPRSKEGTESSRSTTVTAAGTNSSSRKDEGVTVSVPARRRQAAEFESRATRRTTAETRASGVGPPRGWRGHQGM